MDEGHIHAVSALTRAQGVWGTGWLHELLPPACVPPVWKVYPTTRKASNQSPMSSRRKLPCLALSSSKLKYGGEGEQMLIPQKRPQLCVSGQSPVSGVSLLGTLLLQQRLVMKGRLRQVSHESVTSNTSSRPQRQMSRERLSSEVLFLVAERYTSLAPFVSLIPATYRPANTHTLPSLEPEE